MPEQSELVSENGIALYVDERNKSELEQLAGGLTLPDLLRAHLGRLASGDYFAINVYIDQNEENLALLTPLRHLVRDRKKVATTVGFGPRFLHSTGQLHKGGPDSGVFLMLTCDDEENLPIPGEKFSFSVLKNAQSLGDFMALSKRGRRLVRLHLGKNVSASLKVVHNLVCSVLKDSQAR